jgi:hypothetical protein
MPCSVNARAKPWRLTSAPPIGPYELRINQHTSARRKVCDEEPGHNQSRQFGDSTSHEQRIAPSAGQEKPPGSERRSGGELSTRVGS